MVLKYFERLLDFFKPIIASGKTRFVVTVIAISSETYMARFCADKPEVRLAMWIVGGIAVIFVVSKTLYDYYVVKKMPPEKLPPL